MSAPASLNANSLSYLEWKIVEMAREDGRWSLNPDGFLARIVSGLFAVEVARPLANDRFEALRRFAVRAWYWDLIRTQDLCTLIDAGFSNEQARRILAHVESQRGFAPFVQDCLV